MENGKWKMENESGELSSGKFSVFQFSDFGKKSCSACGAEIKRGAAKFCLICGKLLRDDYQPLDRIRSSYNLQGKTFLIENAPSPPVENLFVVNKNQIAETAWACFVYSLVPYLGILFVPLTLLIGGAGFAVSFRQTNPGGRQMAAISFSLSFVVLAVQIFLWWLLYFIPTIPGL